MPKQWILNPEPPIDFTNQHPELPPIIVRLLWNRNLHTQEQIDEFLNPDYLDDIHDPFLFNDMEKAVGLIMAAVSEQKKIVVHGDYDADGVCAAALLVGCLRKLGAKDIGVFIPHREIDGYGLNVNTVNLLHKQKTDLILTCDCGISNAPEIALAKKLGMMVIVTDHHSVPSELPPADAILHALVPGEKYPDKGLAGGAVAFKLIQALLKKHTETHDLLPDGQQHEAYEKWQLDLVAIATVGDMVPLVGESRTLTRYGLTVLNKTRNIGLKKLMTVAGICDESGKPKRGAYDAFTLGFQIVPRLNAAGRMDHANSAFELLMATDENEAQTLAEQLNKNNTDRQKITEQIVNQARKQIKETNQTDNDIIFVFDEKWPGGIMGLVSGKIKDEFYRPAIAMTMNEGEIVGSGRSIPEFNMIANMQEMPEFFSKFGGHPQACGFSLKNKDILEKFKAALIKKATDALQGKKVTPKIDIDAIINLEDVDWKLYDLLQRFEPFGQANEEPRYAAYGLTVTNVTPVGQDGRHLRLMVKHNSHTVHKTIGFGLGDAEKYPDKWRENLRPGDKVDLVFTIGVNEWNGNRELQLTIEDIKRN